MDDIVESMTLDQIGATTKPLVIPVDITPERDDWLRQEIDLSTEDAVKDAIDSGHTIPKIGGYLLAVRAMGVVKQESVPFLREPRLQLLSGAAMDVQSLTSRAKRIATYRVGGEEKTIRVRTHIGDIPEPVIVEEGDGDDEQDGNGDGKAREARPMINTEMRPMDAAKSAERILFGIVVGHIRNNLALIMLAGIDVHQVADSLKDKIDEIVDALAGPSIRPRRGVVPARKNGKKKRR